MKGFFGAKVYQALEEQIPIGQISPSALGLLAGEWLQNSGQKKLLVLFPRDRTSATFAEDFSHLWREIEIFLFAGHLTPVRRGILWKEFLGSQRLCISVFSSAHFHLPVPEISSLRLHSGMEIASWDSFLRQLVAIGLERKDYAEEPGSFRVMGDIVHIWGADGKKRMLAFEGSRLEEIMMDEGQRVSECEIFGQKWEKESFFWETLPPDIAIWAYEWEIIQAMDEQAHIWATERTIMKFQSFISEESVPAGIYPLSFFGMEKELLREFLEKTLRKGIRIICYLPEKSSLTPVISSYPAEIRTGNLSEGFFLTESRVLLCGESDLLGRKMLKALDWESRLSLSSLKPGDLLVHEVHGIGKFVKIERAFMPSGEEQEYLVLQYQGGDHLLVPIEQWDRVHSYWSLGGGEAELSKLGSRKWNRQKEQVRRSAFQQARQLYHLYVQRQEARGITFQPDTDWQKALEESFPFPETPDQMKVALEIKRDMESQRCMDRLLCGDVGFGKTEVAVRAAFKAVMSGYQVVMLCPTTILAFQHLYTFRRRLEPFGVEVNMVSRLRAPSENQSILQKVKQGKVDILIGTHRLLQPDVEFARLGLAIIDEEQKFGVFQKELWKMKYPWIDVCTLTATPIPRTMYMALVPFVDLSILRTPPLGRLPVLTHIGPWDAALCRKAIQREIQRQGQVFYLVNRISALKEKARQIQEWFPNCEIGIAHGQMKGKQLEEVMRSFISGKMQILVCTAIIENGIDIPNADTLIVEGSEWFGLADLHQIRGRVGRGSRQAYAFFFFSEWQSLTEQARQRLKTLSQSAYLGSGFDLARKDLELRGAGNILGKQQHGWLAQVGFTLYARIFSEALPSKHSRASFSAPLHLGVPVSAFLPESVYLTEQERLQWYEDLVNVRNKEEIEEYRKELNRFWGALPSPLESLLDLLYIKLLAEWLKLEKIQWLPETSRIVVEGKDLNWEIPLSDIKDTLLKELIQILEAQLEKTTNLPVLGSAS